MATLTEVAQRLGKSPANVTLNDLIGAGMDYANALTAIMTYTPAPAAAPAPTPTPAPVADFGASAEREQQRAIDDSLFGRESAAAPVTQPPSFAFSPAPLPTTQLPIPGAKPPENPATSAPGTGATPALFPPASGVTKPAIPAPGATPALLPPASATTTPTQGATPARPTIQPPPKTYTDNVLAPPSDILDSLMPSKPITAPIPAPVTTQPKERSLTDGVGNTITQGDDADYWDQFTTPAKTSPETDTAYWDEFLQQQRDRTDVVGNTITPGNSGDIIAPFIQPPAKPVDAAVTTPVQTPAPEKGTDARAQTGTPTQTGTTTTNAGTPTPPPPTTPPATPPSTSGRNEIEGRVPGSPGYTLPAQTPVTLPTVTPGVTPTTKLPQEGGKVGVERVGWSPPKMGPVTARREKSPALPDYADANVDEALEGSPGGTVPTAKEFKPDAFETHLEDNPTQVLTPDEIAAQASRLREMRTMRERAQIELDRSAQQKRYDQQISDAGAGRDQELAELDRSLGQQMARIQAMAIRGGLAGAGTLNSNIPIEQNFSPLLYDYSKLRSGVGERIQSQINQLRIEAALGDADAARRLADLEREGGLIEEQAEDDLFARERAFGETARGNRFDEFMSTEELERAAGQDLFGNQATEAQLREGVRQGRLDEHLKQIGLDRDAQRQEFSDEMGLNEFLERQRQADINRNLQEGSQYLNEYRGRNDAELDLAKFLEAQKSGELDRELSRSGNERENLMSPIEQELRQAQRDALLAEAERDLASAERGGYDAETADVITSNIGVEILGLPNLIKTGQVSAEGIPAFIQQRRERYDKINGAGAFDRTFGDVVKSMTTGQNANDPYANFGNAGGDLKAQRQQELDTMNADIKRREEQYAAMSPADKESWGASLLEGIKNSIRQRDAFKDQWKL